MFFATPHGPDMPGQGRLQVSFRPQEDGDAQVLGALHAGGTLQDWLTLARRAEPYPRVTFTLYAAFVPPLLYILRAPNFIIDLAGDTSGGKTTTLELAASVWGLPAGDRGGLVRSWNLTRVYAERIAGIMNDVPIFFDDSQTADVKTLAAVLYMVANGVGRGRGAQKGGVQRTGSWRTVMFSTGEAPLTSNTEFGGARARTLTLWGSPFGPNQGELVRDIKAGTRQHYGHAWRPFAEALVAARRRKEWPKLQELYAMRTEQLTRAHPAAGVADRIAQYCGAVWVAGDLARQTLGLEADPAPVVAQVMREAVEGLEGTDYATRALDLVRSWAHANMRRFHGRADDLRPPSEYCGVWKHGEYIAIFPHMLRRLLGDAGYNYESAIRNWRDKSCLRTNGGNNLVAIRYGPEVAKMVVFRWDAWQSADVEANPPGDGNVR